MRRAPVRTRGCTDVLLIPCPFCGPRAQSEFTYGGDATLARPSPDAPADAWFAFVYQRENPKGLHEEWWQHSAGCRSWLRVRRDTRTHDIDSVDLPAEGNAG